MNHDVSTIHPTRAPLFSLSSLLPQGTFSCTVNFTEEGFSFSPQHEAVAEGMEQLIGSCLQMVSELPRPLASKTLSSRYLGRGETLMRVDQVVLETPLYQELKRACLDNVDGSFQEAARYVSTTFEDKRRLERFRLGWSASDYEVNPLLAELSRTPARMHPSCTPSCPPPHAGACP